MKEKHVLGTLSIVTSAINPLVGLGFLGLCGWTYYQEYKTNKNIDKLMRYMIKTNHPVVRDYIKKEK
jgi:hypothetical protein